MTESQCIRLGFPALLEFRGPDRFRFLNGQMTQDVRQIHETNLALPSCITDAKGRLQFRVYVQEGEGESIWISCRLKSADLLMERLTRYLIADDVEVIDRTGSFRLDHIIFQASAPAGEIVRSCDRYAVPGWDCWNPASVNESIYPAVLDGDLLEEFRILQGIPKWGAELLKGILPPEAMLDLTDISYQKGCYIGQEVISRIKSAGRVNKQLKRFWIEGNHPTPPLPLMDREQHQAGEVTSISPVKTGMQTSALGFLKRNAQPPFFLVDANGNLQPVHVR